MCAKTVGGSTGEHRRGRLAMGRRCARMVFGRLDGGVLFGSLLAATGAAPAAVHPDHGAPACMTVSSSDRSGRRSANRFAVNADAEFLEPVRAHGVVINASEGGLRVAVDCELPIGVVCVVEITTSAGKTVEMVNVVWSRAHPDGYLVGLEFTEKKELEREQEKEQRE